MERNCQAFFVLVVQSYVWISHAWILNRVTESYVNPPLSNINDSLDRRSFGLQLQFITVGSVMSTLDLNPAIAAEAVLPDEGEIEEAIPLTWEDEIPFDVKSDFARLDSSPDSKFYNETRFVEHVDEQAVKIMTDYISSALKSGDDVLDIGSSWTSHISDFSKLSRVAGIGMNGDELKENKALSEYSVLDLNQATATKLPYADASFDVALCQLSIDYFIHPLDLLRETSRVLKPGGKIVILFSNRLFLSKVSLIHYIVSFWFLQFTHGKIVVLGCWDMDWG